MSGWRQWWDRLSMGARFRALFLLSYVPIVLVGGGLMVWLYEAAKRSYFEQVDNQAELAYTSLDRWYAQQTAFLKLLTRSPEIRDGPSREAYDLLRWIDDGTVGWAGLSMLDGTGKVLMSTLRPYGSPPVDLIGLPFVREAFFTGEPSMSGFTRLPLDGFAGSTLVMPYGQGPSRRALAIHYDPAYVGDFFTVHPFLGRVVVALLDPEGRRLSRSQVSGALGERVSSPAVSFALSHSKGQTIATWVDGVARITAVHHHPPTGWIVVAGTSVQQTLGMFQRMLLAILAIGILGFGLVFVMLRFGIRQASRPIALLVDNARRFGEGDLGVRVPPLPSRELRTLGMSFNQMADELERSHTSLEAEVETRTQELREAVDQLKTLDRLKDHFLSTISHEMKTPLSLIIGYTELLQDKYPDEDLLKGLQEGSRRLTSHINNMLDYSAMLGGSLPLYKTEVSVPEVVQNALDIMDTELRGQNLQIETAIAPEVPPVEGDSRRITQMVLELLDNAMKYTPTGGTVGVEVAPHDGYVRISVWDTGKGIPKQDIGRIWEAFSQAETSEALRKGGLGLGLTIVKKLAELHHGRVGVESQPGKGSRFDIDLPIQPEPGGSGDLAEGLQ